MNKTIFFTLAGLLLLTATTYIVSQKSTQDLSYSADVIRQWKQFKATYGKRYADPDTEAYRVGIFAENLMVVAQDTTGTYGVTQFFDLSPAEFQSIYLTLKVPVNQEAVHDIEGDVNINWVDAGAVTAVKNQQQCGSCWAFSTTGALESALIINKAANNSVDLSEQQLVNCSTLNSGCNGGLMDRAFTYIKNNSITTDANYPYTAVKGSCNKSEIKDQLYTLTGFTDVNSTTSALLTALAKQPIAVAVDATNWSYYAGGVFSNCKTSLNHGVLLVGYQNNNWIVKNSWGTSWGNAGYITLANGNTCGIANSASYPNGAKSK